MAGLTVFVFMSVVSDKYITDKNAEKACPPNRPNHLVVVQNNIVNPALTTAQRCDTLTIKNADNKIRLIGFGEHDRHQAYDGVAQRQLKANESFTITLYKKGTFSFHDHYQDEAQGSFTVN